MRAAEEEFCRLVGAVVTRFFRQNAQLVPLGEQVAEFAGRLWDIVEERGLPPPLEPDETGAPGGIPDAECGRLVERAIGTTKDPLLAEAARQLVKACFYPEFRICRDSFCEVDSAGACRRQEFSRARKRLSGSHCVDCPHWVMLSTEAHEALLRDRWRGATAEFAAQREVFLPEDFRALRQWLHARARRGR